MIIRSIVIMFTMFGSRVAISNWFPTTQNVAFNLGPVMFTWVALMAFGVGFVTYKITK